MIPLPLLRRLGTYVIDLDGANVKVSIEDHGVMVDSCIAELRQLFSHLEESSVVPLVAIDIKYLPRKLGPIYYDAALLILCVGTRCLIVQLTHTSPLPESITELLRDENVFFVGTGDQNGFETLLEWTGMHGCKTVVDLGKMVARFLHNPDIETAGLFQLARKLINLRLEETESGNFSDWGARVFSYEQVKLAIQNAYAVYQIATFLFKVFVNEHSGLDPIKYCEKLPLVRQAKSRLPTLESVSREIIIQRMMLVAHSKILVKLERTRQQFLIDYFGVTYKIPFRLGGHTIDLKVSVEDWRALSEDGIAELRGLSFHLEKSTVVPLVAFDIKYVPGCSDAALLIFFVETRCVIVKLLHTCPFPESITDFLSDQNLIFVGTGDDIDFKTLLEWTQTKGCKTAVEVGHFAAKVLKKPSLDGYGLVGLANEVGLSFQEPERKTFSDWGASNFSHEQVKLAIYNAFASYQIAAKLLKSL